MSAATRHAFADQTHGADISADGRFRYLLWRTWDKARPRALFIMCNPSTADFDQDDPTIRKCRGFARAWGCGGIDVVNAYAYRATDPRDLARAGYPVGPENDRYIWRGANAASRIVLAWGIHVEPDRALAVRKLLADKPRDLLCLGYTQGGAPRHPLMLAYTTPLEVMDG